MNTPRLLGVFAQRNWSLLGLTSEMRGSRNANNGLKLCRQCGVRQTTKWFWYLLEQSLGSYFKPCLQEH